MVVNSDSRYGFTRSATTNTLTSPRHAHGHERHSIEHHHHGIPLRVPTPEETARYNALLDQAACLKDFIKSHNELEAYKYVHFPLRSY